MLKSKTIDQVSRKVYQKYPDVKGSKPKVKKRSGGGGDQGYVLIYEAKVEGPGGKTINRVVRAVTDEDGSISKLSTSK